MLHGPYLFFLLSTIFTIDKLRLYLHSRFNILIRLRLAIEERLVIYDYVRDKTNFLIWIKIFKGPPQEYINGVSIFLATQSRI